MIKKNRIKTGIVIVIIGLMCFSDWSFASESEGLQNLLLGLDFFVSVSAWIWILFAKFAGMFLTNNWVYGEAFGLDVLLWKYWNVVKNFANFGLGFYFVYVISKSVIVQLQGKDDVTKKLKDIILWLLVAGIGIQASWFVVEVVLDVSTITLVAAGSFPHQVISSSTDVQKAMKTSLSPYLDDQKKRVIKGKLITLFPEAKRASSYLTVNEAELENPTAYENLLDEILPSADNVSGPLYFIGFSILKTDVITSISTSDKGIKQKTLNVLIQGGTTAVFAMEMLVLCVLALMRLVYLWVFIVLSPIVVLLWCIQKIENKSGGKNDKGAFAQFTKQINFKTFFINVFQPTIIVLGFGVSVVFVSLMNQVINDFGSSFKISGTTIVSSPDPYNGTSQGDRTYTTELDNNLLHFTLAHAGKTLLEVILSILTVLIVYFIIKIAVTMWSSESIISKNITGMQEGLGSMMKTYPIIPVTGYDANGQKINTGLSLSGLSQLVERKYDNDVLKPIRQEAARQEDAVMKMWGLSDSGRLTAQDRTGIESAGNGLSGLSILEAKKNKIEKTEKGKGMTLGPNPLDGGFWIGQFGKWLTNMKDKKSEIVGQNSEFWKNMINWWNSDKASKIEEKMRMQTMFNENPSYIKAYAEFFFDEDDDRSKITSWNQLMNADISKNKSS